MVIRPQRVTATPSVPKIPDYGPPKQGSAWKGTSRGQGSLPRLILSLKNLCQFRFLCHSVASLVLILFFKITHHYRVWMHVTFPEAHFKCSFSWGSAEIDAVFGASPSPPALFVIIKNCSVLFVHH